MLKKHEKEKSRALMSKVFVAALVIIFVLVLSPGLFKIESSQALGSELSIRLFKPNSSQAPGNEVSTRLFKPNSSQAPTAGCAEPRLCTRTANAAFTACQFEARDDYWIAIGNCNNLSDPNARAECFMDAWVEFWEAREECRDQREARLDICEELGEGPYDPVINPGDFVDFEDVPDDFSPNPYFPLVPGNTWLYKSKDAGGAVIETIKVEVLEETKEILGVNCIVVRDRVWEGDVEGVDADAESLIEDTFDWYAQKIEDGTVWYFGEIAQEFEEGELVSLEGSWKAGKDSAKAGYLMLADPQEGDYYRQEFFLGDAEDMAEVVSRDEESVTVPYGTYTDDVVKTRDWTPMEPDVLEFKYYAPGIGLIKELNPDSGDSVVLIDKTP